MANDGPSVDHREILARYSQKTTSEIGQVLHLQQQGEVRTAFELQKNFSQKMDVDYGEFVKDLLLIQNDRNEFNSSISTAESALEPRYDVFAEEVHNENKQMLNAFQQQNKKTKASHSPSLHLVKKKLCCRIL